MDAPGTAAWLWIPIVLAAAAAQTVRNAVQRSVTKTAGVLPATFIRFAFGLPFAVAALVAVVALSGRSLPAINPQFVAWVTLGAVAQAASTAFFVAAMAQRTFVVAVVFTKTEVLQVGVYAVLFLGETFSTPSIVAATLGTTGVLLLSGQSSLERADGPAWVSKGAMLGLASGACLALCAVGYRGAMLALPPAPPWFNGIYGLVWAQAIQTLLLLAFLVVRDREGLAKVVKGWRVSVYAGLAGALASMGWFTAFAMRSAVDVRVVGLAEVLFSYAVSRRMFREHVERIELAGIALLVSGVLLVSLAGCSSVPVTEVAPKGALRVAIGIGPSPSAFWATRDAAGPRGVTVDLGKAAAAKLGVPVQFVEYRNAGEITAAASKDAWDITFMPHEAEREKLMDHGPAYVTYDSTYIVRAGLEARNAAELDRAGIRVGGIEGTSTSRTAQRSLKNASVILIARADDAVTQLKEGRVDALAMGREALVDTAKKVPGTRVLDDVLQTTGVMVIVPMNRPAARAWAAQFMEDAKADGTVRRALDNAGFSTAAVAPPAAGR